MKLSYILKFVKKQLVLSNLEVLLVSLRSFVINILITLKPYKIFKRRKNGISVLLPTQNEDKIVKLSILSLIDFADEIIVVDNGSIDNTKIIVKKLSQKYSKIKFFDKPSMPDLYQNRQFALMLSKYRWVCRFDSDFVAYTEGSNNIRNLRNYLLKLPRSFIPKAIGLKYINIGIDFWHSPITYFNEEIKILGGPRLSIYEYFPLFTFTRFGRREYGSFDMLMNKIFINTVFFMHCIIKSELNLFLRAERTNWRANGDFKQFPTLISYLKETMKKKYKTESLKKALKLFLKNEIYNINNYRKYDPKQYLDYPELIKKEMKKENIFKLENLLNP